MKKFLAAFIIAGILAGFAGYAVYNPDILNIFKKKNRLVGYWQGELKIQDFELKTGFKFYEKNGELICSLDSPDQKAFNITADKTSFIDREIKIYMHSIGGSFTGIIDKNEDKIIGEWTQGGMSMPLVLYKIRSVPKLKRPQTPAKPYPYDEEEAVFENTSDNLMLSGTLTLPKKEGKFTGILLVSGYGKYTRDYEIAQHKYFLVLSDILTRSGFAVLRYDVRGAGESTGEFENADFYNFASDVQAGLEYLSYHERVSKIGIIAHGEGCLYASEAVKNNSSADFGVFLAAQGLKGVESLIVRDETIFTVKGIDKTLIEKYIELKRKLYNSVLSQESDDEIKNLLRDLFIKELKGFSNSEIEALGISKDYIDNTIGEISDKRFRTYLEINPVEIYKGLKIPLGIYSGSKDLIFPPELHFRGIETGLMAGWNDCYELDQLKGLNHLLQKSSTGLSDEYSSIEETINEKALRKIVGKCIELSSELNSKLDN